MTIHHLPSGPPTAPGQPSTDAAYYRQVLHELIDMGADLARTLHHQATTNPQPTGDPTIPFDRIARAIRRTITLARRVAEPISQAETATPATHRDAARRRIIRGVEDAIQRHTGDAASEALHEEFLDRLDGPELEDDIGHLPTADIIADICRDLGLAAPPGTHPWKRRTPGDVAALCARAALIQPPDPPGTVHALPTRPQPGNDPPS